MNNKMKKIIFALVISCLSITASAGTVYVRSAVPGHTDYLSFSFTGGALTIDLWGDGFSGGPNEGLDDSFIGLFVDDDSPYEGLTGSLVALNDDGSNAGFGDGSTSGRDSFLWFTTLAAGDYVLAVDHYGATEATLRGTDSSIVGTKLDYQLTFSSDVSAVPVPAAVWLLGSGLMGLLGFGRFRKRG